MLLLAHQGLLATDTKGLWAYGSTEKKRIIDLIDNPIINKLNNKKISEAARLRRQSSW